MVWLFFLGCDDPQVSDNQIYLESPSLLENDTGCLDEDRDTVCFKDDCDDQESRVYPGGIEVCDGLDNDCSGAADEEWDADGDGIAACAGDCDDKNPNNSPAIPEQCDGSDNDCDEMIDEGFDSDGDGVSVCRGDCDDDNPEIYFGQEELCDGIDSDCDLTTSDYADLDLDGFSRCDGDCNDGEINAFPGGTEICDGFDNDCNGTFDELPECWGCAPLVDYPNYQLCTSAATWENAENVCTGLGGFLAVLNDATENSTISNLVWPYTTWIGYHDMALEGDFAWVNGEFDVYSSWYPGEPNDAGGEDCAATNFISPTYWNDYPCSTLLAFICEL